MLEIQDNNFLSSAIDLGMNEFKQRLPWIGGDLQTLRDSLRSESLPSESAEIYTIKVPSNEPGSLQKGELLALLDRPSKKQYPYPKGLVLLIHGLGGSSSRQGLRRMGISLLKSGFAILRLNLRGAKPGRSLAPGTYAANCNSDIFPVIKKAREISKELGVYRNSTNKKIPLFGVGISLGGTILLNYSLGIRNNNLFSRDYLLDGLICTSSPLDLIACSSSIQRPRNKLYQKWILQRLVKQTLDDPISLSSSEKIAIIGSSLNKDRIQTIRQFDTAITAPRWGYKNVDEYYRNASPIFPLLDNKDKFPPTLILQAYDDPWVPYHAAEVLALNSHESKRSSLEVVLTKHGGHNGFHGKHGCWGDQLVNKWLTKLSSKLNS